jgi:hypothetical protein
MCKMKSKKILAVAVVAVLVIAMALAYSAYSEKTTEGMKHVTIEVITADETSSVYTVDTDGEYLIDAMNAADGLTFEGEEGPYGFAVNTVNGITANLEDGGAYWAFYVGGEYCNYGVSEQPIEDGDEFSIVYTVVS